MSFADAVKALKKKARLGSIVEAPLVTWLEQLDSLDDGREFGFHASEMFNFCPRRKVLSSLVPMPKEPLDAGTRAKFDIGHALHNWYRDRYLGPMGVLEGTWSCASCGQTAFGFMPMVACNCQGLKCAKSCDWPKDAQVSRVCQLCRKTPTHWTYVEERLRNKELRLFGRCDGILSRGQDLRYILELKTIDPNLFKLLENAQEAHIYQLRVYLWLKAMKQGVIVYIDKSANGYSPIKEFKVEHDPAVGVEVTAKIQAVLKAEATKTLPDGICKDPGAKAKRCPFSSTCFDAEKCKKLVEGWK